MQRAVSLVQEESVRMKDRQYIRTLTEQARDRFIVVNRMHHCALDRYMADAGLHRGQFFMLDHLARCPSPPSQKELAGALEISPAAAAVMLKKLEAQGYILRDVAKDDNRSKVIRITAKGRERIFSHFRHARGVDEVMFDGLNEEELTQFSRCLTKMYENLRGLQEGQRTVPEQPSIRLPEPASFSSGKDESV